MKFPRSIGLGALLLATACTRAPAVAPDASFAAFFQRLRSEPAFRLARTERDWQAEHRQRAGFRTVATETIPCGYVEIERNGWSLLPSDESLQEAGASYRLPADAAASTAIVKLENSDGLYAQYQFVQRQGQWFHSRTTIYSDLDDGEAAGPLPCDHLIAKAIASDAPAEDIPPATISGPSAAPDAAAADIDASPGGAGPVTAAP